VPIEQIPFELFQHHAIGTPLTDACHPGRHCLERKETPPNIISGNKMRVENSPADLRVGQDN
jgi:hypothetical protein